MNCSRSLIKPSFNRLHQSFIIRKGAKDVVSTALLTFLEIKIVYYIADLKLSKKNLRRLSIQKELISLIQNHGASLKQNMEKRASLLQFKKYLMAQTKWTVVLCPVKVTTKRCLMPKIGLSCVTKILECHVQTSHVPLMIANRIILSRSLVILLLYR